MGMRQRHTSNSAVDRLGYGGIQLARGEIACAFEIVFWHSEDGHFFILSLVPALSSILVYCLSIIQGWGFLACMCYNRYNWFNCLSIEDKGGQIV